jgi:hypothetical protein
MLGLFVPEYLSARRSKRGSLNFPTNFALAFLQAVDAATAANSSVPLVDPTTGEDLRLEPNKLTVAQLQVGAHAQFCPILSTDS